MRKHYFRTRDLVTMAVLGCLGATMSTYLGYIGHLLGEMTGVPVLSQTLTGLHVFWVILVLALVDKKGAAVLGACLNNFVQFLMGSHLGIWVLPIGLIQGILAETGYWPFKRVNRTLALALGGGLASTAHIFFMQVFVLQLPSITILLSLVGMAFLSGIVCAGLLTRVTLAALAKSGLTSGILSCPAKDGALTIR